MWVHQRLTQNDDWGKRILQKEAENIENIEIKLNQTSIFPSEDNTADQWPIDPHVPQYNQDQASRPPASMETLGGLKAAECAPGQIITESRGAELEAGFSSYIIF